MAGRSCLIVTGIYPPDIGGPATYVPHIAAALAARGWTCSVVTLAAFQSASGAQDANGLQVHRIARDLPLPIRVLQTAAVIRRALRHADVVFSAGLLLEAALGVVGTGKPLVAKIVGDEVWERATRRGWTATELDAFQTTAAHGRVRVARALRAWSLRHARRIVAPSRYTAGLIASWGATRPADVIYNAVPPSARPGAPAFSLDAVGRPRFVMMGRLIPLKRVGAVIHMLSAVPDVHLVIVGEGPERAALGVLAVERGLEERVHFTGSVPAHDAARVLSQCDVLVLNSTTENCPHVVLEAFGLGVPVVATRVGGVPELFDDQSSGCLVDPDQPQQMADALLRAASDVEWRRRASADARLRSARFDWNTHVAAIDRVLSDAAGDAVSCTR